MTQGFDEWFKKEMPNTYEKKDNEKIEALVYSVALATWSVQQARIDDALNMVKAWKNSETSGIMSPSMRHVILACAIEVEDILKGEQK